MTKIDLNSILEDWNYWRKSPPSTFERVALSRLHEWSADLVWVVQGVRRCGKSTLLTQIMQRLGLDPQRCFFVNFEDPRLTGELNHHLLDQIVKLASERAGNGTKYFFFDEIQNVEAWERWLHRQVERPGDHRFVITGSNAALLSGDLGTALTGRHQTIELFPFDYSEFQLAKPERVLEDFLSEGGFPRALSISEPKKLLREYFTDIIERDVRRHVNARSSQALMQLARAIFESTGSETSFRKLAAMIDSSTDTVHGYVDAFIAAYLILPCPYFTFSERKRAVRPIKFYPIDLGMRDAVLVTPMPDRGKRLETLVFHYLRRTYSEVFYWRGKGEVDFVVMEGNRPIPIQVTWDTTQSRHTAALQEFKTEFPTALDPIVVTRADVEKFMRR